MAILNSKKNKETSEAKPKATKKAVVKVEAKKTAIVASKPEIKVFSSNVILKPRVTEKAAMLSTEDRMVLVFEVSKSATKNSISDAVRGLYKVTPEKVAVLKVPAKKSFVRGRVSKGKTGRKAYVYLKKGDKVEVI